MPPFKKLYLAILIFGIAVLSSCSNNIKYPTYKTKNTRNSSKLTEVKKQKPVYYNSKTYKGVLYLKLHKCNKAINYFSSLSGFLPRYCLLVSYGYCSMYKKAKGEFAKLENLNIDNEWQAKVYATYGLILMSEKKGLYRDYLTVAYAYDEGNKLARELMLKKSLSINDKKRYYNEIFGWCVNK